VERDLSYLVLFAGLALVAFALSRGEAHKNRRLRLLEHRVYTLEAISADPQLELAR
jgi:hypothetical protein